jgi:hypothetical protein
MEDLNAYENKTKQNKTKQNKTKQNKTKQNKTKQNKTPLHDPPALATCLIKSPPADSREREWVGDGSGSAMGVGRRSYQE